jgi:hypothetical protein
MLPAWADVEKFTVILLVFAPEAMDAPVGRLHVYPVAFATAGIL